MMAEEILDIQKRRFYDAKKGKWKEDAKTSVPFSLI